LFHYFFGAHLSVPVFEIIFLKYLLNKIYILQYHLQNVLGNYITNSKRFGTNMKITIRDVAKHLDLSITTVSRALDGYPDVAETTRQRVIQAANELGYIPNRTARQLRRQSADTIGYILPTGMSQFSDPFSNEFISGLADEAAENNFDLLLTSAVAVQEAEKKTYHRWVRAGRVDGFVINRVRRSDWRINYLAGEHIPFASFERSTNSLDYPSIHVEAEKSVANLVTHLTSQGYKRIAFIGGSEFLTIQIDRLEGYRRGLAINQLQEDPALVHLADLSSTGGYQAAKRMLWLPDPPDAIVCINDETAFGVLHAAHEAGRVVGANLAVTGFDGVQDSIFVQPSLTTLVQPVYHIARQLMRMVLSEIDGTPLPERQVTIEPTLRIRASTTKQVVQSA
jgi:LacI family transcriptional regulator